MEDLANVEMSIWPDYKSVDLLVSVVSYRAQGSFSVSISLLSAPKRYISCTVA